MHSSRSVRRAGGRGAPSCGIYAVTVNCPFSMWYFSSFSKSTLIGTMAPSCVSLNLRMRSRYCSC